MASDFSGWSHFSLRSRFNSVSEAETCLNGLRLVARAGFEALGIDAARVRLKASSAEVARAPDLAPGVTTVRERAGPAGLDTEAWPMAGVPKVAHIDGGYTAWKARGAPVADKPAKG